MIDPVKIELRYDNNGTWWFPTEEYKHALLLDFATRFGLSTFIETGTCDGHCTRFASQHFKQVYSIELGDFYYNKAVETFKNDKNVTLIHGDSGAQLWELLSRIPDSPTLFYLDAHFSGGQTVKGPYAGMWHDPLEPELKAILDKNLKQCIIVVDDMQDFWHSGLPEKGARVVAGYPDWEQEIKAGMMRIWRKT
jgi:hypothetical protein